MSLADDIARLSPRQTAGVAPPRAPGSVRRTSTIDVAWPDGPWGDMLFTARARDIVTPRAGGAPLTRAEDSFVATIDRTRTITDIGITPERPAQAQLIGQRGGGHLRRALEEIMPDEKHGGTPLHLILDDISGASLVAGWAWSQWTDDWLHAPDGSFDEANFAQEMEKRTGICVGFAPGGSVLKLGANRRPSGGAPTPDLRNPADPEGWHAYAEQTGVGMRRARRIDVTRAEQGIVIEAAFQDSGTRPDGGRAALHEGERLADLRALVLERLRGTAGCTHLNDALRALAEVPQLVALLEQAA